MATIHHQPVIQWPSSWHSTFRADISCISGGDPLHSDANGLRRHLLRRVGMVEPCIPSKLGDLLRILKHHSSPIGSMYGIYANIGGILMVNVTMIMAYIRILWEWNGTYSHFFAGNSTSSDNSSRNCLSMVIYRSSLTQTRAGVVPCFLFIPSSKSQHITTVKLRSSFGQGIRSSGNLQQLVRIHNMA